MITLTWFDSFGGVWESLTDWVNTLLMVVINLLPNSPFQSITMPSALSNIIGYINYFIPISEMIIITTAWLTAVLGYYVLKVVLNWLKVTKGG